MNTIKIFNDIYEFKKINSANTYFHTDSNQQKIEILLKSLSFNSYNTVETIFITFPQLWKGFSKSDWTVLLKKSILELPNDLLDSRIINSSSYAFFRIMCKYLNINAWQLAQDNNFMTSALKSYGRNYSSLFYVDNEIISDELNDYGNITLDELKQISNKLESEGCVLLPPDENKFLDWL